MDNWEDRFKTLVRSGLLNGVTKDEMMAMAEDVIIETATPDELLQERRDRTNAALREARRAKRSA